MAWQKSDQYTTDVKDYYFMFINQDGDRARDRENNILAQQRNKCRINAASVIKKILLEVKFSVKISDHLDNFHQYCYRYFWRFYTGKINVLLK